MPADNSSDNGRIKEQISSKHGLKNETDGERAGCILEILNHIEEPWTRLAQLSYKIGIKRIEQTKAVIYRDEFGKEAVLTYPVYSNSQISGFNSKWAVYLSLILFFLTAESFLYYLSAVIIVPKGTIAMKIIIGAFFGLLFTFILDFAFKYYFLHLEAIDRFKEKIITENKLKEYEVKRNAGYFLIVGAAIGLICAGISRIYFLENIPEDGLSKSKLHSVLLSSRWASILTLVSTVLLSVLLAFIKHEFSKLNKQMLEYWAWKKANIKANQTINEIYKLAKLIQHTADRKIEKYWMLVIDIKRIFKEREFDSKYEAFHQDYWELRSKLGQTYPLVTEILEWRSLSRIWAMVKPDWIRCVAKV